LTLATITPSIPSIDNLKLPRQPLLLTGETGLLVRINDYLNISIIFETIEEKMRFTQTLGDLDPL
jgi:hypothetical protein